MKVVCIMSHEMPLGGGMFTAFEAGREYEVADPHEKFFQVIPAPELKPRKKERETATEADGITGKE